MPKAKSQREKIMNVYPLPKEQYGNFTHQVVITAGDLTEATAATAQVLAPITVAPGVLVVNVAAKLVTPFQDASDAALDTTTITVGDGAAAAAYLASMELNENGTEIDYKAGTGTQKAYIVADTIDVTVGAPNSGKALADVDTGEVHIFLQLADLSVPT